MAALVAHMARDRFLTGYACGLAEGDGFQAMREFMALKPPKVTNYGIKKIMQRLPGNTGFTRMGTLYPGDEKSLARGIRTEMLKRWASFEPEAAARHVIDSPDRVAPQQMAAVITTWAAETPAAAAEWLATAPVGTARDEGMSALAQHWIRNNRPEEAWRLASHVTDFDARVATATEVFQHWEKIDRDAAVQAWIALLPQQ